MEWRVLDRPAARFARLAGLALAGLSLTVAGAFIVLPFLGRAAAGGIELLVAGCVWLATSIGTGVSLWDVVGTIALAAIRSLVSPTGSLVLAGLVVVGIVALYWLQRLLESEESIQ
jgi:hypothetical protein